MNILGTLTELGDLVYPRLCIVCEQRSADHTKGLCLHCLYDLPQTDFHHYRENPILRMFTGRIRLQKAAAFLYFEKNGITQKILHQIKYKSNLQLASMLGEMAGSELLKSEFLEDIDLLIPIPLHPRKKQQRGFNQSEIIAQGMSLKSGIPLDLGLAQRLVHTFSQTNKARFQRWENVSKIFARTSKVLLPNKHLLLIDDVITTGSTIEALAEIFVESDCRVSVFCMAFAP